MKLAIIGNDEKAQACAQCFEELGAYVRIFSQEEIRCVHKRFLDRDESIPGRTRLLDLFRVVFLVRPSKQSMAPELLEKLNKEVLDSLEKPYEGFEDFDLVVDVGTLSHEACKSGPGGMPALNELLLAETGQISYSLDDWQLLAASVDRLMLVGRSEDGLKGLEFCQTWLSEKNDRKIVYVTTEKRPFENLSAHSKKRFEHILAKLKAEEALAWSAFKKELDAWDELEDYMKAKIKRPVEPQAQIQWIPGSNVTSMDRLIDREQLYLTVETAEFRLETDTPLQTIGVDHVLVLNGQQEKPYFYRGMAKDEPGFYRLKNMEQISQIREDALRYFRKV